MPTRIVIAEQRVNLMVAEGSIIPRYGARCRECGMTSPPLSLYRVVDWAREHNRNRHSSKGITRRSKFDKRVQRLRWQVAKRALKKLGHNPVVHESLKTFRATCLDPHCTASSTHLTTTELRQWAKTHRIKRHSHSQAIEFHMSEAVEQKWRQAEK